MGLGSKTGKTHPALKELDDRIYQVLGTYSNVHRGSGPFSEITTAYYDQARSGILEYTGLNPQQHQLIFLSPRSADELILALKPGSFQCLSGKEFGLTLGIRALAVRRKALPKGPPSHPGGGTAKLISREWVLWASHPEKFEAGTPAIIPVIMFAEALKGIRKHGPSVYKEAIVKHMELKQLLFSAYGKGLQGRELLEKLRDDYILNDKQISAQHGETSGINLDNSASTPTFEPIWEVFRNSKHLKENSKKELLQEVRQICAGFLNAPLNDYEFLFCSNTTEAINLAAENLACQKRDHQLVVLSTLLEHSSNDLPWRAVPGCEVIRLGVDEKGFMDLEALEEVLKQYNELASHGNKRIELLALSGASNVLGVCNDLEKIIPLVHRYGAKVLVDAAQLVAHRPVDVWGSEIDYLAFSGHKIYAPFGSGMLVARKDLLFFQKKELSAIRASGEENVGGIAALGKALSLLGRIGMDQIEETERKLTTRLLNGMAEIPGIHIYGIKDPHSGDFHRKIGVLAFNLDKVLSFKVAKELARRSGVGIRAGCHCSHILVKHILHVKPGLEGFQRVMQKLFPGIKFPGVARVSLGLENTESDVDVFLSALKLIASR